MVSAVGLTESAKGELQAQLAELGTNLIIAQAGGTFGSQNPTFPEDAVERVENVSTVTAASATTNVSGVVALPVQGASTYYEAFPVPVRAADNSLPSVLNVPVVDGRWLDGADNAAAMSSPSCSARGSPSSMATCPVRSGRSGSTEPTSAWSAYSAPVALDPDLDNAAFVTQWAAQARPRHQRPAQPALHPC